MKYILVIMDMDDVDPRYTLGPYDDGIKAEKDGELMVDYLNDETMPGHARPHEWSYWVNPMQTYEEALIAMIDPDKRG